MATIGQLEAEIRQHISSICSSTWLKHIRFNSRCAEPTSREKEYSSVWPPQPGASLGSLTASLMMENNHACTCNLVRACRRLIKLRQANPLQVQERFQIILKFSKRHCWNAWMHDKNSKWDYNWLSLEWMRVMRISPIQNEASFRDTTCCLRTRRPVPSQSASPAELMHTALTSVLLLLWC